MLDETYGLRCVEVSLRPYLLARTTKPVVTGPSTHRRLSNGLPDGAPLGIIIVYWDDAQGIDEWHLLAHVCRRLGRIVFALSSRLDLCLLCTEKLRVREMTDIWPALSIVIEGL